MPPKSPQSSALQKRFYKFCQELAKGTKKEGEIRATQSVNPIKEIIRNYRFKNQTIDESIIVDILAQLENNGKDICSRIEPSIFCCAIETALQSKSSRQCQRIIYLLGASLHRDANSTKEVAQALPLRKSAIGKECLIILLEYYIEVKNSVALRRWVGILCIQLCLDCDKNQEKVQLAGEDIRQNLGRLIFDDPDELLRLISGQLIRNLHEAGTPLDALFPSSYSQRIYEDFPPSTPNNVGWFKTFQDYLDALSEGQESQSSAIVPASAGTLYYATFVTLTPGPKFGVANHNVFIFMDCNYKQVSIMSTAKDGMFDQILDISPIAIHKMATTINTQSQKNLAIVEIYLQTNDENTILDSQAVDLDMISMRLMLSDANGMKEELLELCPGLEIQDGTQLSEVTNSDERNVSQVTHTSTVEIMVHTEPEPRQIATKPNSSQQSRRALAKNGPNLLPKVPVKVPKMVEKLADVEVLETNREGQQSRLTPVGDDISSPLPSSPTPQIVNPPRRNGVKPKAKKPLTTTKRTLDIQLTQSSDMNLKNGSSKMVSKLKNQLATSQESIQVSQTRARKEVTRQKQSSKLSESEDKNIYDFPADDDERKTDASKTKKNPVDRRTKASGKTVLSTEKIDKRKSAPAMLQQKSPTRKSQRASASRASKKFADVDNSDNEEEILSRPAAKKYSNGKPQSPSTIINVALMEPLQHPKPGNTGVDKAKAKVSKPILGQKKQPPVPPQADGTDNLHVEEDLYSASPPRKKVSKIQSQEKASQEKTQVLAANNQNTSSENETEAATFIINKVESVLVNETTSFSKGVTTSRSRTRNSIKGLAKGLYDLLGELGPGTDDETSQRAEIDTRARIEPEREILPPTKHRVEKLMKKAVTPIFVQAPLFSPSKPKDDYEMTDIAQNIQAVAVEKHLETEIPNDEAAHFHDEFELDQGSCIEAEPQLEVTPNVSIGPLAMNELHIITSLQLSTEPRHNEKLRDEVKLQPDSVLHVNAKPRLEIEARREEEFQLDVGPQPEVGLEIFVQPRLDTESLPVNSLPAAINWIEQQTEVPKALPSMTPISAETDKKRKAEQTKEFPAKKQKSDAATQTSDHVDSASWREWKATKPSTTPPNKEMNENNFSVRRSPRLAARQSHAKKPTSNRQNKSPINLPSLRRSPRSIQQASKVLEKEISNNELVDERLIRKPQVISFGLKGAQNQGLSTIFHGSEQLKEKSKEEEKPESAQASEKKRKREANFVHDESPAKKRQHSSPSAENYEDEDADISGHVEENISSSPPVPISRIKTPVPLRIDAVPINLSPIPFSLAPAAPRPKIISRPNSQSSKVDKNGSPIAPASRQRDHIRKLKAHLAKDNPLTNENNDNGLENSPTRFPDVFGPRITLSGSVPKAGPASPEAVVTRYVAHERVTNGLYREVSTTEVIEAEQALPDPFMGLERRPGNFTKSLRKNPKNTVANRKFVPKQKAVMIVSPLQRKGDHRIHATEQHSMAESRASSGSSGKTRSSGPREPLKEMLDANDVWNMAIRPHYTNLHHAVHKIADELIIRLSGEEDKMNLIVDQYEQNGMKIVNKFTTERNTQRDEVLEKLDEKKAELVNAYDETKRFVEETSHGLKENSVSLFEKEWLKQQQQIQKGIAEGRKVSE